jgi:hypothetical protein
VRIAFRCSQSVTLRLAAKAIEREVDLFASYLLMPIDDFREQVKNICSREVGLTSGAVSVEQFGQFGVDRSLFTVPWLPTHEIFTPATIEA